jgi:hypothetical protein
MARSKITSSGKDLITDDGAILLSVVKGEQIHFNITLGWLSDLTGYTILCKVVEGANDGEGSKPTGVQPSGVVTSLTIIDTVVTDNEFKIVIPQTLGSTWTEAPKPDKAVYGFIDLEIADTGIGAAQQVWKPLSGLIEISYSPTEAS